jgi:PIN domain nuclease of toxin-antitoxin system
VDTIQAAGFSNLPILCEDAVRAGRLPQHHRDPFDRMLVAQAARVGATIVSRDAALDAYGVSRLPA